MGNLDFNDEMLDSAYLDSSESIESSVDSAPQMPLSEFLARENLQKINGKYQPNDKQLKSLVRYDEVNLGEIDTSKITNMKSLFANSKRRDFSGIEGWDTSNVRSFAWCFYKAEYFNADISAWNVSNARQFRDMFYGAVAFNQPIGAKWNTQNAEAMIGMFCQAKNFNNGGEPFGKSWKMDKVKLVWNMFRRAEKFNAGGLNAWNMSSVTKCEDMFAGAKSFNQPLEDWNVANVCYMQRLFNGAESFNQNLSAWGTKLGKVRNAKRAFADTKSLKIDFLKSWRFSSFCDKENITKGSALESSEANAKNSKKLDNFIISQIDKKDMPNKAFESIAFKESYAKWLPANIKKEITIYLAKYDENDNLISGDEKSWDFAFYKIFKNRYFMVKKYESNNQNSENDIDTFSIIQKRKISDLQKDENFKADKVKDIYESNDLNIKLDSQNMWITNSDLTDNSESILSLLNIFMLTQSYIIEMQKLEEIARENGNDSKKLRECYKEICDFDLQYYRNLPILQNVFLQHIWYKMSEFYRVAQTHDELKEIIAQMAQILGDDMKEKESRRFNIAMGIIGILSALGAILAAIPVVEKWVN
ncbi:BspA family leucine-rich repeat surface protein [Helicobacter sp. 23-1045]